MHDFVHPQFEVPVLSDSGGRRSGLDGELDRGQGLLERRRRIVRIGEIASFEVSGAREPNGAGVRCEQADAAAAVAANDGRSVKGLREAAALHVADLEAEGGNTLTVRRSKTNQEGEGVAQYIGGPTVVRVRAGMDAAGIADGPLFQRLDKAGKPRGRLSTQSIRAIIQRRAQDAGIEGRVSGHSLRVGSAQSLATAGAFVVELQTAGIVKLTDCRLFSAFLHEAKPLKLLRAAFDNFQDFGVNPVNLTMPVRALRGSGTRSSTDR